MSKKLFIASSSEGEDYATVLKLLLMDRFSRYKLAIDCVLWKDSGVFRNGVSTFDNLERIADELYADGTPQSMGYAVCVLTPDEIVTMRGEEYSVARDNVLFEYGLFLGKLGHERTFLLVPPKNLGEGVPKFHTLSDLEGITSKPYPSYEKGITTTQIKKLLSPVAQDILDDIYEIENRPIPSDNLPSNVTPPKGDQASHGNERLTKY